jgi:hypothetical protein
MEADLHQLLHVVGRKELIPPAMQNVNELALSAHD